jgi:hypothetical protein
MLGRQLKASRQSPFPPRDEPIRSGSRTFRSWHDAGIDAGESLFTGLRAVLVPLDKQDVSQGDPWGDHYDIAEKIVLDWECCEAATKLLASHRWPDLQEIRAWVEWEHGVPSRTPPPVAADDRDWILVSQAVARLPFINGIRALYRYSNEHPDKLRLRPHPEHPQRRQANAADVLRLEIEHDAQQFEAMGRDEANDLPPLTDCEATIMAERIAEIRRRKSGK